MAARRPRVRVDEPDVRVGISYERFSLEKQGSIPEQRAINEEVAAEHDIRLVKSFDDPAVSRTLADRNGLLELFDYLEGNREVRYIVVNELERLTAGVTQRSRVVKLCKRLGVTIVTEDMGAIDPFDDEKMHEADQRAIAGQGEVLKIRRRTRRNTRQKVLAGTVVMRPAFGTRMKPLIGPDGQELPPGTRLLDAQGKKLSSGELEVVEEEFEWLRQMFDWADEGLADEAIAARLTKAGVPTKNRRAAWRGTSVAGILTNRFYIGELKWGHTQTVRDADGRKRLVERAPDDPERLTLASPLGALVDPELFERVQSARAARAGRRRGRRRTYGRQLLDDFVYCGRCGHKMYGRNDAAGSRDAHRDVVIWRYYCYSTRPGYQPLPGYRGLCRTNHSMQAKKIVAALSELVTEDAPDGIVIVRPVVVDDSNTQRDLLSQEIQRLQMEQDRAEDLAIKGLISEAKLATTKATCQAAIAEATATLQAIEAQKTPEPFELSTDRRALLAELVELLGDDNIPVEDRRAALREFGVERIFVDSPRVDVELVA